MSCCWSYSNSSLKGFCSAYARCIGSTQYTLLSGFTYKETSHQSATHSAKKSSKSLCGQLVISALAFQDLEENIQFHNCWPLAWMHYYCLNLNYCLCLHSSLNCCLCLYSSFLACQFWALYLHSTWCLYLLLSWTALLLPLEITFVYV